MEPSAFWRAKGVYVPHLVSILDSNLIVYQESFQSADTIISKYLRSKYCNINFNLITFLKILFGKVCQLILYQNLMM